MFSFLSRKRNHTRAEAAGNTRAAGVGRPGRGLLKGLSTGEPRGVTCITIEHGIIKVLLARGRQVLDHRINIVNPRFFREGMPSDARRTAEFLRKAFEELPGEHRRLLGAVPGYQTTLGKLELPRARGMDPSVVIPREARRTMGISPDVSYITWRQLPDNIDMSRWMVVSATRRSISSLTNTLGEAGLWLKALELRPFALARAVNQADAIVAWTSVDGCDVIVIRGWIPMTHQSAYWGAEPVEAPILTNRLTEIVDRAIADHEAANPEMPLPEETPLYVTGSPVRLEPGVGEQVAANLQRTLEKLAPPIALPADFPLDDLIVNLGLALWEA